MSTIAVPAPPRASTTPPPADITPHVYTDRDGNASVLTPFAEVTYLEHDCLGERIEGWPAVQLGDVLGSESDLREHIAACQALLESIDPGGVNRLPEGHVAVPAQPAPAPAPLIAPTLLSRTVAERPAADIAAELTAGQARVLSALANRGATLDVPDHGRVWNLGLPEEREPFTDADHTAVLALSDHGLLVGYLLTSLGHRVDEHLRQAAGLGAWDTAVA